MPAAGRGLPAAPADHLRRHSRLRTPVSTNVHGLSILDAYMPILIAFVLAMLALNALPSVLAGYREKGILRRLARAPVGPGRVLAAQLAVNVAVVLVTLLLLLGVPGWPAASRCPARRPGSRSPWR
jgi:ABC-2 type transport system permease protein